jgi:hypothetical protein
MLNIIKSLYQNLSDFFYPKLNTEFHYHKQPLTLLVNGIEEKDNDNINSAILSFKKSYTFDHSINNLLSYKYFDYIPELIRSYNKDGKSIIDLENIMLLESLSIINIDALIFVLNYKKSKNERFSKEIISKSITKGGTYFAFKHIKYIIDFYDIKDSISINYIFFELYTLVTTQDFFDGDSYSINFFLDLFNKLDKDSFTEYQKLIYNCIKNKKGDYYLKQFSDVLIFSNNINNF